MIMILLPLRASQPLINLPPNPLPPRSKHNRLLKTAKALENFITTKMIMPRAQFINLSC